MRVCRRTSSGARSIQIRGAPDSSPHTFRRDEARADLAAERPSLAHTLRGIAAHLHALAIDVEHRPLDEDEHARVRSQVAALSALVPERARLVDPKPKQAGEPWTLDELRSGWVDPLGAAWAHWTQVMNATEFAADREAMIAVAHTLRALRAAFWEDETAAPTDRSERSAELIAALGTVSRRYLAKTDDDLVEARADAFVRLRNTLARTLHRPFFVWSAPGDRRAEIFTRTDPGNDVLGDVADKATSDLLDALDHGWGFSDVKADLPAGFAGPEGRSAVRAVIFDALCHRGFDPGPADGGAHDLGPAIASTEPLLKRIMSALGYGRNVRSIFDALDKRAKKGT